jgi:hypothetical protein
MTARAHGGALGSRGLVKAAITISSIIILSGAICGA